MTAPADAEPESRRTNVGRRRDNSTVGEIGLSRGCLSDLAAIQLERIVLEEANGLSRGAASLTEGKLAIGALILLAMWLVIGLPWLVYPSARIEYRDSPQSGPQGPQAQPSGSANAPFFVQVIPTPKSAEERTQEAEDREEKKSADKWLVRWTFALFAATMGLIFATGVLGYFANQQARDMKASVAAAEEAAKAAKASADALPIIEGAYVYPVIAKDNIAESLSASQRPEVGTNRLQVMYYFKNFGRTPANVLMYRAQLVHPDGPNLQAVNTETFRIFKGRR
jgi:hypothetical protein